MKNKTDTIMNSLEFIEKIIKNLKEILKGIDKRIQDDQNYPTLLAHDIGEKEHFEKELAYFQQIKTELEEYNEIKKYGISYDNFKSFKEQ